MDTTTHASPPAAAGPLSLHGLSVEGVNQCVHCGLCLAYCPTFSELGTEMDSPRGRIFTIKSLAEGRMTLGDSAVRHLSLCLDCRACETVCPAGVPYGRLIEAAKAEIEHARPGGLGRRLFRWLNFGLLLGHPRLLGLAASGARLYQASGLQRLVRKSGLVRLLPGTLPAWAPRPAGARESRTERAASRDGCNGRAASACRDADWMRAVRDLRRPQSRDRARARQERFRGRRARGAGMLRRAQRPRRRSRARA